MLVGLACCLAVLLFGGIVFALTSSESAPEAITPGTAIRDTATVRDTPDELEDRLAAVEQELAEYKAAIGADPEAAVRLPLVANDVADLERRVGDLAGQIEREADTRQAEDDHNYDQVKWLFSLLLVGMVGLLITRVFAEHQRTPAASIDVDALLAALAKRADTVSDPAAREAADGTHPRPRVARKAT